MYSLPIRTTLAALTIASAASTEPRSPLVSTRPSASDAMARNSNRLREMRQPRYNKDRISTPDLRSSRDSSDMMRCRRSRLASVGVFALAGLTAFGAGCRRKEASGAPVATQSVSVNLANVPLGSPLEVTYKFVVASDGHFDRDYRVMMHVVDADEEFMWADDHNPPVPTTQWKPGQTVEYTRTVFVPIYPYVGEASIQVGLYSTDTQKRLALSGDDVGQRAYRVGRLQLLPQTENVPTVFKDGWHPAEVAEKNASVEWQWTKK